MNGQDLIDYIQKHHLEEAELDISVSDSLQFVVTVPESPASIEGEELVYDFTKDFVYDRYLHSNRISYEEAEKMRNPDLKEDKCLFYDPYKGQFLYLTMAEAERHVNRNKDIYTGRFIPQIYDSKPCLIMETKETKDDEVSAFKCGYEAGSSDKPSGKWIATTSEHGTQLCKCSVCNSVVGVNAALFRMECPNCGCRMVEP